MKYLKKLGFILAGLIIAMCFPLIQVQAEQSNEYISYFFSQKNYLDDELNYGITYSLSFPAKYECFFYGGLFTEDCYSYRFVYWDSDLEEIMLASFNSVTRTETNYVTGADPVVKVGDLIPSIMDGSYHAGSQISTYVADFGGVKVFSSYDAAEAYFKNGDESGWINKTPDFNSGNTYFDSSLGYLQGVQYKNVTPTDVFPYQIYSQISWNTSNENLKDAYIQVAADVTYKISSKIYSESMVIFKDYGLIKYADGKCSFLMSDVASGFSVPNINIKKVDYYYVRLVKYDKGNSIFLYGGWTRIDTNKFTIDTIAYDEEKQDYYIDTDSDSSYSDQMGIDGNYGTTTWGDLSSASADSFKWFFSMLKDLFDMMGSFPSMLKTVFSFLPSAYINCLSLLLMACIIMRILGR